MKSDRERWPIPVGDALRQSAIDDGTFVRDDGPDRLRAAPSETRTLDVERLNLLLCEAADSRQETATAVGHLRGVYTPHQTVELIAALNEDAVQLRALAAALPSLVSASSQLATRDEQLDVTNQNLANVQALRSEDNARLREIAQKYIRASAALRSRIDALPKYFAVTDENTYLDRAAVLRALAEGCHKDRPLAAPSDPENAAARVAELSQINGAQARRIAQLDARLAHLSEKVEALPSLTHDTLGNGMQPVIRRDAVLRLLASGNET